MSNASQSKMLESLIRRGPMTVVLVFSPSCPHCHTYMPLWKELERTKGKRSNMVSVRSDIYDQTSLGEKKQVAAVPTVLFVDKNGSVTEAAQPRNMPNMKKAVTLGVTEAAATADPEIFEIDSPAATAMREASEAETASMPMSRPIAPVLPGTTISENPLPAIPATPISEVSADTVQMGGYRQYGGNPWAAFMMAARQAAPAAALLGAYVALPAKRSSGLPAARRSRRRVTRRSLRRH
jgi:hypothetical protein